MCRVSVWPASMRTVVVASALPLLLLLPTACKQRVPLAAGYHEYAYVTNGKSNSVSVIDLLELRNLKTIPVGTEPHGLTVWPQPGRFSLGHTGNMR